MNQNYQIDSTDRAILRFLLADARMPYLEIARKLHISGGTVHQRVDRMRELGIISGSKLKIEPNKLGLGVSVLVGIHLKNAKDYKIVLKNLEMFDEVVQAFYTTGNYALIVKIFTKDVQGYHHFLINKLQNVEQIQSTETFLCLDTPIDRDIYIEN